MVQTFPIWQLFCSGHIIIISSDYAKELSKDCNKKPFEKQGLFGY